MIDIAAMVEAIPSRDTTVRERSSLALQYLNDLGELNDNRSALICPILIKLMTEDKHRYLEPNLIAREVVGITEAVWNGGETYALPMPVWEIISQQESRERRMAAMLAYMATALSDNLSVLYPRVK